PGNRTPIRFEDALSPVQRFENTNDTVAGIPENQRRQQTVTTLLRSLTAKVFVEISVTVPVSLNGKDVGRTFRGLPAQMRNPDLWSVQNGIAGIPNPMAEIDVLPVEI